VKCGTAAPLSLEYIALPDSRFSVSIRCRLTFIERQSSDRSIDKDQTLSTSKIFKPLWSTKSNLDIIMTELIVLDAAMYTAPTAASASTTSIRARPSFIPLPVAHDRPQSQRVYRSHRIQPFRLRAPSSEVSLQISSLYTNGTKILADDNLGGSQISGRQGSFTHGVLSDDAKPRFRLFSELPVELRLRIWGFAAPPPTVIDGMHYMQADMIFGTLIMPPLRAFPALLRVCSESRNAMLYKEHVKSSHPTYQISSEPLVVTSEGNLEHDCHHAQTYVSFGYDVPYLREILTSREYW
jgi:hypothetical protein